MHDSRDDLYPNYGGRFYVNNGVTHTVQLRSGPAKASLHLKFEAHVFYMFSPILFFFLQLDRRTVGLQRHFQKISLFSSFRLLQPGFPSFQNG